MRALSTICLCCLILYGAVAQQTTPCSALLSEAEAAFREGRLDIIVDKLESCLGVRKTYLNYAKFRKDSLDSAAEEQTILSPATGCLAENRGGVSYKIRPPRMYKLVAVLHEQSTDRIVPLGSFEGFGSRLAEQAAPDRRLKRKELKAIGLSNKAVRDSLKRLKDLGAFDRHYFSGEEQRRAYLLLGKTYYALGVKPLAEFFAERMIKEHPISLSLGDEKDRAFRTIFKEQRSKVQRFSIGPQVGWYYTLPLTRLQNRVRKPDYKFRLIGRVGPGAHFSYYFNENLSLCLSAVFNGTDVEYQESSLSDDDMVDFVHRESHSWLQMPLLLKWIPSERENIHRTLQAKWFIQGGMGLNMLTKTQATIVERNSDVLANDFEAGEARNRVNGDALAGMGLRFRFGRSYFNISANLAYSLGKIVNQDKVGTLESPVYREFGVIENNYHTLVGFWLFSYEVRFNAMRKDRVKR